jgi:protein-S-isoprenylcysteine O-methyltransferase Ste14
MSKQGSNLLFKIARLRIMVSRIFGIVAILVVIFTASSFKQDGWIDILFETSGLFLLSVCAAGRLWALLYISGKKTEEVVADGPYSIVRHPLYFFSFIGAIGIGLASKNILVLGMLVTFYLSYYPLTILSEENVLTGKFGQAYLDYAKRTPRFLPKPSLYNSPSFVSVNTAMFLKNITAVMGFIWIYILFDIIEMLQKTGIIPVLLRVP